MLSLILSAFKASDDIVVNQKKCLNGCKNPEDIRHQI
jgi:hypothetical protein